MDNGINRDLELTFRADYKVVAKNKLFADWSVINSTSFKLILANGSEEVYVFRGGK